MRRSECGGGRTAEREGRTDKSSLQTETQPFSLHSTLTNTHIHPHTAFILHFHATPFSSFSLYAIFPLIFARLTFSFKALLLCPSVLTRRESAECSLLPRWSQCVSSPQHFLPPLRQKPFLYLAKGSKFHHSSREKFTIFIFN